MELTAPIRRGICEMRGTVYAAGKVAAEANLVAQVVKKQFVALSFFMILYNYFLQIIIQLRTSIS